MIHPTIKDWLARKESSYTDRLDQGETIEDFGDPTREHQALRKHAGLITLPGWAPMLVEGADAIDYLHRRLSQHIHDLPMGLGAHALQLGGDGRMQADCLVYRGDEVMMLFTRQDLAEATWELVEKYTLMDDVQVDRFWQSEPTVALAGSSASLMLADLVDPKPDPNVFGHPWCGLFTINLAGLPCRVFRDGRYNTPVYLLCAPPMAAGQLLDRLLEICEYQGGGLVGEAAWDLLRLENGITLHGIDTTERTIPLEAGLYDAVHFNKGCYPGQEFMARINNLGHPARQLVRLEIERELDLESGQSIMAKGEVVGEITSARTWPGLGRTLALGFVKWDAREEPGFEIADERVTARAEIIRHEPAEYPKGST